MGRLHQQRADRPQGRPLVEQLLQPDAATAVGHFWANDVVGDLQGQFDLVWTTVAEYFKDDPWVIGYDPYNEPFSTETQKASESTFTGSWSASTRARPTRLPGQRPDRPVCPPDDPRQRRRADHPVG